MDVFAALGGGFGVALQPGNLFLAFIGCIVGSAIGVLFGAQSLGASVAPLLGGLIADRWGLSATFYFLAGTIVCANLFILAMPRGAEPGPAS